MTKKFLVLSFATTLLASSAFADSISISQIGTVGLRTRAVTATESGGGAPVDGDVYQWQVTTDGDILSVNGVLVTLDGGGTLYNHPQGNAANAEPGDPVFIGLLPALGVDSWITTPGNTGRLGADLPGDGADTSFGDTSNDGAKANFMFAQLTVPKGTMGTFAGKISIAGATGPFVQSFSLPIGVPEPATLAMAGMGLVGMIGVARRRKA